MSGVLLTWFQPNGSDAIKKVQELPPFDLILMDIIMPGMDGLTATREILRTEKNVMIIAMTSNISVNDVASYFENGTYHSKLS